MQIVERDGTIDLYWLTVGDPPESLKVHMELLRSEADESDTIDAGAEQWDVRGFRMMSKVTFDDPRETDDPPLAEYDMMLSVEDPETGEVLEVTTKASDEVSDAFRTHARCYDS